MRHTGTYILVLLAALVACASCDGVIYDGEGDCAVTYRLKFRYDRNMKYADAFAQEVRSVSVYAFDKATGTLVWQNSERGDALAEEGYSMPLGLAAGKYTIVAWCGLDNGGAQEESFTVPQMTVGTSRIEELTCRLNRQAGSDGKAYTADSLQALYHGMIDVELPANDDGGDYAYTVPLTKNTNSIKIMLQQMTSGTTVSPDDFTLEIVDDNGLLNYDNEPLTGDSIAYKPYSVKTVDAEINAETGETAGALIASFTVSRLMASHNPRLVVRRTSDGSAVINLSLVKYFLLFKDDNEGGMTDQEYLDREDTYNSTFFLTSGGTWLSTVIYVNAWRVVIQNTDLGAP